MKLQPKGQLFRVGGPVSDIVARLRISGDSLDPDAVTGLLQCEPNRGWKKGDARDERSTVPAYNTGVWMIDTELSSNEPPERHIMHLLSRVTSETTVWKMMGEQYDGDITLGLFLGDDNQEFRLSPTVLQAVADRRLGMNIDIYALGDDGE